MATSGKVSTNKSDGHRYAYLEWTQTSKNNVSTISWTAYIKDDRSGNNEWYMTSDVEFDISCPSGMGEPSKTNQSIMGSSRVEQRPGKIGSGSFTITHNLSGQAKFTITLKAAIYTYAQNNTGTGTWTLPTLVSACTAPTSVTLTPAAVVPGKNITVKWSGAKAGNNNSITEYRVYYRVGSAPTKSASDSNKSVSSSVTSTTFTVPTNITRGSKIYAGVVTRGSQGSDFYSDIKTSSAIIVNRRPSAPSISSGSQITIKSTASSLQVKVSAGTDKDGQSYSVVYSTSASSTEPSTYSGTIDSSTLPSKGNSQNYYFWTYDGVERSENYTTLKVTRSESLNVLEGVVDTHYKAAGSSTSAYTNGGILQWDSSSSTNPKLHFTFNGEKYEVDWPGSGYDFLLDPIKYSSPVEAGSTVNWSFTSIFISDGIENTNTVSLSGAIAGLPSQSNISRSLDSSSSAVPASSTMEIGQKIRFGFARDYSISNENYSVEVSYKQGDKTVEESCSVSPSVESSIQYLDVTLNKLPPNLAPLTFKIKGTVNLFGFSKTTTVGNIIEGKHPELTGSLKGFPQEIYPLTQQGDSCQVNFINPFAGLTNINTIKTQYNIPNGGIKLELHYIEDDTTKEINLEDEQMQLSITPEMFMFKLPYGIIYKTIGVSNPNIISTFNGIKTYVPRIKIENNKGMVFYGPSVEGGLATLNFEEEIRFTDITPGTIVGGYGTDITKTFLREGMTWGSQGVSIKGYSVSSYGTGPVGLATGRNPYGVVYSATQSELVSAWDSSGGYWQIVFSGFDSLELEEITEDIYYIYPMMGGVYPSARYLDIKFPVPAIRHTSGVVNLNALNVSDNGLEYDLTFEDTGVSSKVSVASSNSITISSTADAVNNSSISSGAYFKEVFVDEEGNAITSEFSTTQSGRGTVAITDTSDWDYKNISLKVVTWIKQDGFTTRKEYVSPFLTAYKTVPLIAYRKNRLGINTSEPEGSNVLLDINALDGFSNIYLRRKDLDKEWQIDVTNGTMAFISNNAKQWELPYAAGNGIAISSGEISLATVSAGGASFAPGSQTPSFGGTFDIPSISFDSYGRVASLSSSTVKIPNAAATTSVAGLMSATDKSKLNKIGEIAGAVNGSTSMANQSIPGTSIVTNLGSFELGTGTWLVKVHVRYNSNATGNRTINISESSGGEALSIWNTAKVPASATSYTHVVLITFLKVEGSSKTFYVNTEQNSGSTISCTPRWGAILISN